MIRVLLVDDQKMVRESLKISLKTATDIEVVGTANNGIAAIEQVEMLHPDIVIMNMEMPGLDGASATKQITSRFLQTKVLIHTSYDNDEYITRSLAMGAKGYLLKTAENDDLAGVIRNINKGYTQIAPGLLEKLLISTDSGVVISKLEGIAAYSASRMDSPTLANKPQKTIASLKVACRQQQDEINKLRQNIESIEREHQELPKLKQDLSRQKKSFIIFSWSWLLSLPLLGLLFFLLFSKTNNLQREAVTLQSNIQNIKSTTIPSERVGLYGEFSLSGIAQRVSKAYEQDAKLRDISTVYVAQEDDAIVLFGTITNASLLKRMENIAMQVEGVKKVYTSQVAIESRLNRSVLGAGN